MPEALYIIVENRRYGFPRIVGVKKRTPRLKVGQASFKLEIDLPHNLLSQPAIPVRITKENLMQIVPRIVS